MDVNQATDVAPTIIKRKKVHKADGHHGGAWKVAYADFVTAMMAFFLLMWLLNATTEEQRKGISDYFNPTIPISRISGGGADGLNGSSIFSEQTYAKMGTGAQREKSVAFPNDQLYPEKGRQAPNDDAASTPNTERTEIARNLEDMRSGLSEDGQRVSEHLLIKMSPEGIVLEITDSEREPLFELGQSEPSLLLGKLLSSVSGTFGGFENEIKIVGHTDNRPYRGRADYDNWDLSADRANTARRLLTENGLEPSRIVEVSGKADTDPLVPANPAAAQNRRISITILTE